MEGGLSRFSGGAIGDGFLAVLVACWLAAEMGTDVGARPRIFSCSSSPIIKLLSWVISALITVVSPAA